MQLGYQSSTIAKNSVQQCILRWLCWNKAKATEIDQMKTITLGVLYPREIFATLATFRDGLLFDPFLTGGPAVPRLHHVFVWGFHSSFLGC